MLAWARPFSSAAHLALGFHYLAWANGKPPKMAEIDNDVVSRARCRGVPRMRSFRRCERMEWVSLLSEIRMDARRKPRIWSNHASGYAEYSRPGRCPFTGRRQGCRAGHRRDFDGNPDPGRAGVSSRRA